MPTNCIIIEDEPLAQERLRGFVSKLSYLNLLSVFDNGIDARAFLRSNAVDLIFLDINMGEFSGIQLLESTSIGCQIIIITAYHEYALKGFELNVTDYLLKPYTFERFLQAVDRAQNNLQNNLQNSLRNNRQNYPAKEGPAPDLKFIFVKTEHRLEKVVLGDVLYIEGMRDYRRIHTLHKQIMTLRPFREFEQEIPPRIICRVHKSFMVSLDKIESIERDRIRIRDKLVPISDTYKRSFFELLSSSGK
ncbi:MAG: LytTR family DNA-binding domain-containing protein [Puia sp.]|nr:LytTR family DNA-binding domain-containing protein [Puia sp.]